MWSVCFIIYFSFLIEKKDQKKNTRDSRSISIQQKRGVLYRTSFHNQYEEPTGNGKRSELHGPVTQIPKAFVDARSFHIGINRFSSLSFGGHGAGVVLGYVGLCTNFSSILYIYIYTQYSTYIRVVPR